MKKVTLADIPIIREKPVETEKGILDKDPRY